MEKPLRWIMMAGATAVAATAPVGLAASPALAASCGVDTGCLEVRSGHTDIAIRTGPGTSYSSLGTFKAGQTMDCYGYAPCDETSLVVGQTVTACGTTSSYWWVVRYHGRKAYTTFACVAEG